MMLDDLPKNYFRTILADPPWRFETWSDAGDDRSASQHYETMTTDQIAEMPVRALAAPDCVLIIWITWPMLLHAIEVIDAWRFVYKTCAFAWIKADASQIEMFADDVPVSIGTGYWTRANSEVALLATRGHPQRVATDVRQAIIEPRREHSRKPDCVHRRIEQLCAGPYLELFARTPRTGWQQWGNEIGKFREPAPEP